MDNLQRSSLMVNTKLDMIQKLTMNDSILKLGKDNLDSA